MQSEPGRHVVAAERIDDGVIITFDDGRCAVYSAALLYSFVGSAETVSEVGEEQWPPE